MAVSRFEVLGQIEARAYIRKILNMYFLVISQKHHRFPFLLPVTLQNNPVSTQLFCRKLFPLFFTFERTLQSWIYRTVLQKLVCGPMGSYEY